MQDELIEKKFQDIEKDLPAARTPIPFLTLERVIDKHLLIKDRGLLKVLLATVVANKLHADPVWLFIVAAPGGTKTELIRGLGGIPNIYAISDLTPQTLLSGEKGKQGSLLLRVPFGTIFVYKDFTTILSMHRDKQQAIMSQLREIYDGSYRKEFGTGETKDWKGKIGFIAGVTTIIDRHYEVYAVLGERFLQYRPEQPDPIALARKAMSNSGGEDTMREEIQNGIADFVAGVKIPEAMPALPETLLDRIANLATFCVRARSGVIRDGYSTREIELIPDTELPTRMAKQLVTLCIALSLIGTAKEECYELIHKIGMDSIPQKRRKVIGVLLRSADKSETQDIGQRINYPTTTTRRTLEELHGLGLVSREDGKAYKWGLSNYARDLLAKAESPASLLKAGELRSEAIRVLGSKQMSKQMTFPEMSGDQ